MDNKNVKSLITEATVMDREDSDLSLPPLYEENESEMEVDHAVTFSRNNTYLSLDDNQVETSNAPNRSELLSRAASRNLSRASFRNRKKDPDKAKKLPSDPIDFDAEFKYDSDDEDIPVRYSSAAEQHRQTYQVKCQKLGIIPCRKALNQFSKPFFDLSGLNLTSIELHALYVVMINDVDIVEIDLSGNKIGVKDINCIAEILKTNKTISTLYLRSCGLNGKPIQALADALGKSHTLRKLDISDNNFDDKDAPHVASIIEHNESICNLNLSKNKLGDSGIIIGNALMENEIITSLDLSWNHLRCNGAIGIARGVEKNTRLMNLKLAWNGFAFEGCAALGHALIHNSTLCTLDLCNNRIHNPAMFELLKGICHNRTLSTLRLAQNPITAPMTSIIIQRILDAKECGLKELDLEGVVVDKDFDSILNTIQENRLFMATYGISLPVKKGFVSQIDKKNILNIDPIRILFLMKEHMRTIDMLFKFDKDNSNTLSREELHNAFKKEGYPISSSALDSVMKYLDTNKDGNIDLLSAAMQREVAELSDVDSTQRAWELIDGERRLKRQLISEREEFMKNSTTLGPTNQEKREYSRSFLKPSEMKTPTSPRTPKAASNKLPELNS